jgi:hypothetical protein
MHNREKQLNIPAELADNLIGSLGDLTTIDGAELRRQVVMLIDHSYALGYVAGASAGLAARMRSRIALAEQDIKLALFNIRELSIVKIPSLFIFIHLQTSSVNS